MQFGYFDDANKEYVITRPDTPRSWSNYLGTTEYGAIITNNAGGYSFYKSSAQGRFTRLRFNSIPMDQAGRYIYIHDRDKKDYWSASWQPVGKPLDTFKSECRHGTAYTSISSEYDEITAKTTYFVPLNKNFECWVLNLKNTGKTKRRLRLFSFVEYACNWNASDDLANLQYTQYTASMQVKDSIIDHGTNVFIPSMPDNFQEKDQGRHTFLAVTGADVTGYDTDREVFIGPYRTFANPLVVEEGECKNSIAVGDNPCGTLQIDVELQPDESRQITFLMGIGSADVEGKAIREEFSDPEKICQEFEAVKTFWHSRLKGFSAKTPDAAFNSMINMWNPFNSLITYTWSRAASLIYTGARDGLGYRDSVQDMLGVMHLITDEARERLELLITGQCSTGGAMPVVKQFAHKPGHEKAPSEKEYRSDDSLWLFDAISSYVKESGNIDFYRKVLPYADEGRDSVFMHMRRAIEFNLKRSGAHNLPCGLLADWNDCLELGHNGESVFVAFQLRHALRIYAEVAAQMEDGMEKAWALENLHLLDHHINENCWDGDWFLRAFRDDGFKFGSHESDEGNIWLNPQSWSIISGCATEEQAEKAMESVNKHLATEYGIVIVDPPYEKTDYTVIRATLMNKGMKENGAIFCHTQGWAVMAEALLGHGDRAFEYYCNFLPAAFNDRAEIREIEPYVYCQSTHGKHSPRHGKSRIPWLSGTATWAYYAAMQFILGIKPGYCGLEIDPCIPAAWDGFTVQRIYRGKLLKITVQNPLHVQKGISRVFLNGVKQNKNCVPAKDLVDQNEVLVIMG